MDELQVLKQVNGLVTYLSTGIAFNDVDTL